MSITKDTKIQLNYFVPTPVWEMFQKRVRDFRFRGVGCVVYYLLCTSLDVIIAAEKEDSEDYYVQGYFRDMVNDILEIRGYTTKDFRREKAIHVSISGDHRRTQILQIMKNHDIPTPREFLRRLVLFFLNNQYILFKKNVTSLAELDSTEEEEEDTLYDDYVKRDLRYEYYKKQAQA